MLPHVDALGFQTSSSEGAKSVEREYAVRYGDWEVSARLGPSLLCLDTHMEVKQHK